MAGAQTLAMMAVWTKAVAVAITIKRLLVKAKRNKLVAQRKKRQLNLVGMHLMILRMIFRSDEYHFVICKHNPLSR